MIFKLNNNRQSPAPVPVLDFLKRHLGAQTP
jgi:primosomal replication protein N